MTSNASQPAVLASWERAIELFNSKLTQDKKKKIDLKDCQKASFEELLKTANEAKDRAESKRFRWTPTVRKIFQQISQYAVAGDIITQYNTEYTSVAWGSFRFLLQVRKSISLLLTPVYCMLTKHGLVYTGGRKHSREALRGTGIFDENNIPSSAVCRALFNAFWVFDHRGFRHFTRQLDPSLCRSSQCACPGNDLLQ
jgi:hypothetical protein